MQRLFIRFIVVYMGAGQEIRFFILVGVFVSFVILDSIVVWRGYVYAVRFQVGFVVRGGGGVRIIEVGVSFFII